MRAFFTALRTLTVLPLPGKDCRKMSSTLYWFPLVGALLGTVIWAVVWGLDLLTCFIPDLDFLRWDWGLPILALTFTCWVTGGLHLDGLADWADGFFGSRDKGKTLAIMKDPRLGTYGVIALLLVLLLKLDALQRLLETPTAALWVIVIMAFSRTIQVELAGVLPYARAEGGKAQAFVEGVNWKQRSWAWSTAIIFSLALVGPLALALPLLAWPLARLLGHRWRRRIGGITGDLLGAASEITETFLLLITAWCAGSVWSPIHAFTGWRWLLDLLK